MAEMGTEMAMETYTTIRTVCIITYRRLLV